MEHVGDANNSLDLWATDLDLVRSLNLNTASRSSGRGLNPSQVNSRWRCSITICALSRDAARAAYGHRHVQPFRSTTLVAARRLDEPGIAGAVRTILRARGTPFGSAHRLGHHAQ